MIFVYEFSFNYKVKSCSDNISRQVGCRRSHNINSAWKMVYCSGFTQKCEEIEWEHAEQFTLHHMLSFITRILGKVTSYTYANFTSI